MFFMNPYLNQILNEFNHINMKN